MKARKPLTFVVLIVIVAGIIIYLTSGSNQGIFTSNADRIPPGTPKKVQEQIKELDSSAVNVRLDAISELAKQKRLATNAIPFLIDVLGDFTPVEWSHSVDDVDARIKTTPANEAYKALDIINENWRDTKDAKEAVDRFIATLKDKGISWRVRINAAKALKLFKDNRALKPLIDSFNNTDEVLEVRKQSAYTLTKFGGEQTVDAFIVSIQSDDILREFSVNQIVKLGEIAVEPLIALLDSSDSNIKISAMHALKKIGDIRAIEPLIACFKDSNEKETINLVNAFEGYPQHARVPLLAALKSDDYNIRKGASKALWRIKWRPENEKERITFLIAAQKFKELKEIGKPTIKPITALLSDGSVKIRKNAADTLVKIGWKPSTQIEKINYYLAARKWSKLVKIGKPAVKHLIAALGDETLEVRENSAISLGRIGDPRGIDPLYRMLNDKHSYLRKTSVEALTNIGGDRVVEMVISCLYDENFEVRVSAAGCLGRLKDVRAIDPLLASLKDESEQVQIATIAALKKMGYLAFENLEVSVGHRDWFIRKTSVELLSHLKGSKVTKLIIDAMKDDDWVVRRTAAHALKERGWEAKNQEKFITYLIATLNFEQLVDMGQPSVEPLIELLYEKNPGTRKSVLWALSELRDRRAVQPIISLLIDPDYETRADAAIALGKFGDLRAVDPLLKLRNSEKSLTVKNAINSTLKILLGNDYKDALNE